LLLKPNAAITTLILNPSPTLTWQYIDTEEYPSTEKIKEMCVSMLADLWHAGETLKAD
jgi:glutamate/tyrosine decarboxylase-like PLP-dependent enzyme